MAIVALPWSSGCMPGIVHVGIPNSLDLAPVEDLGTNEVS